MSDVVWGDLDLLLIDLPPGTDRLQDLAELAPGVAGVVAVTIPSEESRRAVSRAMRAAREAGLALLGVVENMSGYACPGCGTRTSLFPGDAGDTLAKKVVDDTAYYLALGACAGPSVRTTPVAAVVAEFWIVMV